MHCSDLQDYIRIHEKHVKEEAVANLPTQYGDFKMYGYINDITGAVSYTHLFYSSDFHWSALYGLENGTGCLMGSAGCPVSYTHLFGLIEPLAVSWEAAFLICRSSCYGFYISSIPQITTFISFHIATILLSPFIPL